MHPSGLIANGTTPKLCKTRRSIHSNPKKDVTTGTTGT